jgi:hypothetical protein
MKNISILITAIVLLLINTSCSGTWDGVKSDSGKAWDSTKKSIHEATR